MATCPKCEHKFRFRVVDDLEPAASIAAPKPQNMSESMAAQRAAAAQAWKRMESVKKPEGEQTDPIELTEPLSMDGTGGVMNDVKTGDMPQADATDAAPRVQGSPVPFEDLPNYGFFGGIWQTVRMVIQKPAAFFSAMPITGGMGKPLAFHLLLAEFMVVCQFLWGLSGIGGVSQYAGSPELMDLGIGLAGAGTLLLLVFYPLLLILRLLIMTGIIHLLLKMLRFGQGGAEGTFRVLCYSAAPLIIGIVPFVGPIVGGIWSIGITVIGLKYAHRTPMTTALFAVLVPILMLVAALLGMLQGGALHAG
jgi:Uncharacterized protein conserved in archaea